MNTDKNSIKDFLVSKGHAPMKALEIAIAFQRGEKHAIDGVNAMVMK